MKTKMEKEIRSRTIPVTESNTVEGYALNWSEYDMGSFMERIDVNALGELRDYDVHALYNHDYDRVLARSKYGEGTLALEQDQEGLKFRFDLPDTSTGNEVRTLVGRGDVDQASWAFTVKQERWENVRSEKPTRVIEKIGEMYDISLTPRGANPTTSVALRSLEKALQEAEPEQLTQNPETVENHENEAETRANTFVDASAVQGQLSKSEARNLGKFNIIKAINEARNGKLTGLEAEVNQEGLNEKRKLGVDARDMHAINMPEMLFTRTQSVTGGAGGDLGGDLVFTEPGRYIDFLYPNTPTLSLCSVAENLVGNIDFPKQTSSYTLNWQTETGTDTAQDINFDKVNMSPKRAVITASMSNQLLRQEYSRGIEQRVIQQLNLSFNKGLENAVLNGSGTSNVPSGIYTELAAQALSLGAITFDDLVDMEAALAAADALAGNLAYVTHPNVVAKLKKTKVDAGSGRFLVEGMLDPVKTANGYNIFNTTVSKKTVGSPDTYGLLFGNFSDVQIGFWGGATLMVDPYTNMKSSIVEIYVERFMDVACLRPASFALATDVTI
jgi:HK97 family phage major capsid protein/HK97 family phage prohead protease